MAKPNLPPYPISPFEGYDEVTIRCNPYPIRVVALCTWEFLHWAYFMPRISLKNWSVEWIDLSPDGVTFHQRCGGLKVWVISEDAVDPERFLDELGPSKVTSRDQIQWIEMAGFHQKHLLTKPCGTDGDSGAVNVKGVVEGRPKFFLHHCKIPLKRSLHLHPGFQYSTSRKDRKRYEMVNFTTIYGF